MIYSFEKTNFFYMSHFQGSYLRVRTPKTIDGLIPKMGYDNRPLYKESHLPLSARKHLERKNKKLPKHLQHIIEVVDPLPVQQAQVIADSIMESITEDKQPGRRGRKPKIEEELNELEQTSENE